MKKKSSNKKEIGKLKARINQYLGRRPHRSFRRTLRRDYRRSLELPGYVGFTKYVLGIIWKNRKLFLLLALTYATLTALMVGITSQDAYSTLKTTLSTTNSGLLSGAWGEVGKAGLLFLSTITGSASSSLSEGQQIYAIIIILLTWLTSVWILRNVLANRKVKLRDGLYSAGAPILPTFLVALLIIVQLLPFAIAIIGYSAASTTILVYGGIESMLFWAAAGLLTVLSIYLVTGTIFALIVVTLPGMYPMLAIRTAGDLVVGRRLRIFGRLMWMAVVTLLVWAVVVIPTIIFDSWIKDVWAAINWLPIVPMAVLVLSSVTVIWVSSYIYLLYRKVVDDGSAPA